MSWSEQVFEKFQQARIGQVTFVPDAGHKGLIERCQADTEVLTVSLTSEEEGVALLAGAWLGGQRGALLMQSSGIGNCVNMLAFARACRLPLFMLITMRGQWGEFNPWQVPMGQSAAGVLRLADVIVHEVDAAEDVGDTVAAALHMTFESQIRTAVLLSQRLIGAKSFGR